MPDPYILCCAGCVCCDCNARQKKREAIRDGLAQDGVLPGPDVLTPGSSAIVDRVIDWVFDNFDLAPKGLGQAIVKAYRPIFEMAHKVTASGTGQGVSQGLNKNYDTDDDEAMFNPALPVNPNK